MELIQYDFDVQNYVIAQNVTTECIDLLFINTGTNTAFVRNIPIIPGVSLPINGNVGEIINQPVNISFDTAGAGINNLIVVRRYYL